MATRGTRKGRKYIEIDQLVDVIGPDGKIVPARFLIGKRITIPLEPFPGIEIFGLTVLRVCISKIDGKDTIEVVYRPIDQDHAEILKGLGWREGIGG